MKASLGSLVLAFGVLCGPPALAHHSKAFFDMKKVVYIEGTVKDLQWTNPHAWLDVVVPGKGSAVVLWSMECGAPTVLNKSGWMRDSVKVGDKVKVAVHPLVSGLPGGDVAAVIFEDGRKPLIVDWAVVDPRYAKTRPTFKPQ